MGYLYACCIDGMNFFFFFDFVGLRVFLKADILFVLLCRYLRLGFWHALGHVRPDVVVFLGDLLDEGSVASDSDYQTYVKRFKNVFTFPDHVQVDIFIAEFYRPKFT